MSIILNISEFSSRFGFLFYLAPSSEKHSMKGVLRNRCSRRGFGAGKSRCSRIDPKIAFLAELGVLSGNYIDPPGKMRCSKKQKLFSSWEKKRSSNRCNFPSWQN